MRQSRFMEWENRQQKLLQARLNDSSGFLMNEYAYDFARTLVEIKVTEAIDSELVDGAILKHTLTFVEKGRRLLSFEFTKIRKEFEDALWHPETTEYVPCGIAKILTKIEVDKGLHENEIRAVTHAAVLMIDYGLVVCEEIEMMRQPEAFQEIWHSYWKDGKPVTDRGVRYFRYDDPFGWNAD